MTTDVIGETGSDIAPNEAAIVFAADGAKLLLPKLGEDEEVPAYILAATELLLRAQEEGIDALAKAFESRSRS